jgi:glycosyltransferase involved in cell wall biosynthesis
MGRVCLLAPSFLSGDALGHEIAGMFAALAERGIETHVLAQQWAADIALPVEPLDRYATYARQSDTLSIYHLTTSWPIGCKRLLDSAGPKVVRYHNITPAHFMEPYCAAMARACREGRREMALLAQGGRIDLFLSDSRFNQAELLRLGVPADRSVVLPPLHPASQLSETPAAVAVLERFLDQTYNILFIGRVVPNKGHRHLLGVLAAFQRLFARPVRLIVVGELQTLFAEYHEELHLLARGLRVADKVVWTGKVPAADLKAYCLLAHAFLVMSEHEGFCVPIVEAMANGIPVVAHHAGAVPETVGDAGIVLSGLDYDHYAAALALLFEESSVRDALVARGHERVRAEFDTASLGGLLIDALQPLLARGQAAATIQSPGNA